MLTMHFSYNQSLLLFLVFVFLALLFLLCCSPLLPCCSLLCHTCCHASAFLCLVALKVVPCFSRIMPYCSLPCCTSLSRLVLLVLCLVAYTLLLLLHGYSHLTTLPSFFSHLATFEVVLCFSYVVFCCFCTLLFVALLHLVVVLYSSCVVPCCLGYFVAHNLLFTICCSQFVVHDLLLTICYSCFAALQSCLTSCWALLPCHHAQLLAFFRYLLPLPLPLLFCYLVAHCRALLLCLVSWYSLLILLCKWRSLEQHQQASSNNKGNIFFQIFLSFFFFALYFVCLFCFCLSFFLIEYILFQCSL